MFHRSDLFRVPFYNLLSLRYTYAFLNRLLHDPIIPRFRMNQNLQYPPAISQENNVRKKFIFLIRFANTKLTGHSRVMFKLSNKES